MKRFLLIPLAAICFFAFFKNADAQYLPFSAKDGLSAARQAVIDAEYTDAYLISIQTKWSYSEGTYEYDEEQKRERWNGLEFSWDYTFHRTEDSTYYNFQVMRDSSDSSFIAFSSSLPEVGLDTNSIADDNWIDSDENINIKRRAGMGEAIKLHFNIREYSNETFNKLLWVIGYFYMEDLYATIAIDPYTGEIIYKEFIGSVKSKDNHGLSLYPNPSNSTVTISGENVGLQFETINIFTAYGQKIATIPCSSENTVQTIPADTFPANGLYFLKLSGKNKSAILPVTIQGK